MNITFLDDYRCFKQNDIITLKYQQLNVLVGDQGTGKSTLLFLMANSHQFDNIVKIDTPEGNLRYFDFELMNPRIKSKFDDPIDIYSRHMMSHGELNRSLTDGKKLLQLGSDYYLADEPDSALSVKSIIKLIKSLKTLEKNQKTVIASIHNPLAMMLVSDVYSLEHREWMKPIDYLSIHVPKIKTLFKGD